MRAEVWQERARAHAERADALTAGYRARKATGERHAIEDFLFEYYNTRPSLLRRWHPGPGVVLEAGAEPAPHAAWRWYRTDDAGAVTLDAGAFLADRADTVRFVHRLLTATASRPLRPANQDRRKHRWRDSPERSALGERRGPASQIPATGRSLGAGATIQA